MKAVAVKGLGILCLFVLLTQTVLAFPSSDEAAGGKIAPELQEILDRSAPQDAVPVIVTLKDQADLQALANLQRNQRAKKAVEVLQAKATGSQRAILAFLDTKRREGNAAQVTPFWVFNGLALTANRAVITELANRQDVFSITADQSIPAPPVATSSAVELNVTKVNAPALWELGYRGQGVVVANMDTGVNLNHPDLVNQWRGGSNSWYDPYGQHPTTPADLSGHGTSTMGVMVGRSAGGTAIGVAPDARWIAAKIFDDQGYATTTAIHLGYQWLLDPDKNPGTDDAPHVVNNSWTYQAEGCILEFQLDLRSLRAAGILPVFAAGNAGPSGSTSRSPGNNPEAFAVGATDDYDQIGSFSSRGVSACGGDTAFPDLVAPGLSVHSSDGYGYYADSTGTSLAAPHVAGSLALLLSARPDLSVTDQERALISGAIDLGSAGLDSSFGYGRLDVLKAYNSLQPAPVTPTPTATTPTILPTATTTPPTATATATPTLPPPTATATPTVTAVPPTPSPTPGQGVNLALNRPVSVSSYQDSAHSGARAVDGSLSSYWQSKKVSNRRGPSSEWIRVDLGGVVPISQVVLEWNSYYARSYRIEVSPDNSSWTTLFTTTSGNGGNDTISFSPTSVRYVRMTSTAWSNSSLRNWLRELRVYGSSSAP